MELKRRLAATAAYLIIMAALVVGLVCPETAQAVVVDMTGGTVYMVGGGTATTTDTLDQKYSATAYEENGFRITINGAEAIVGDYYSRTFNVLHAHWGTPAGESIVITKIGGGTFDLSYFELTSNTAMGGGPATGNELTYITSSNNYSVLLPPVNWGSTTTPTKVVLGPEFKNITSATFSVANTVSCFGLDMFYIDEPAPSAIPGPPTTTTLVDLTGKNCSLSTPCTVTRKIKGTTDTPDTLANQSGASFIDTGLLHNTIYEYIISGDAQNPVTVHTTLYSGWNTLGVPNTEFTLTGGTVSTYYEWVPSGAHYPTNADQYDIAGSYSQTATPSLGKGYFAKPSSNATVLDSSSQTGATAEVTLKTGYTLITSPVTGLATGWKINGGSIAQANAIDPTLYYWNGMAYDDFPLASGTVEKFKAYWILNTGTEQVTLTME